MKIDWTKCVPFAHPGFRLKGELHARNISKKELAIKVGRSQAFISRLLKEQKDIDKELAYKLEEIVFIPAERWLAWQKRYYEDVIKCAKRDIKQAKKKLLEFEKNCLICL